MGKPDPISSESDGSATWLGWNLAHWLLLLMSLVWGATFAILKSALEDFQPLSFNALRFLLASGLLTAMTYARGASKKIEKRDLVRLIGLGVLENYLYQLAFIYGLSLTRAGNAALILGATPVFTTLLSAWRGHERLGHWTLVGVMASFLGVSVIVFSQHGAPDFSGTLRGDLLIVVCTLIWPIYSVGLRPLVLKYGDMECTRITMLAGTVPLVITAIPALVSQSWGTVRWSGWFGLVYGGAGSIALCYSIWSYCVRQLGNTPASAYSNLTPIFALAVAWLCLGEQPLLGQVVGMGVIFIGIYVSGRELKPD